MKIEKHATAISLFLGICILSTCALTTKRLFVSDSQFDGHSCSTNDTLQTFDNIRSKIDCIASCMESGCLDVFYFPGTNMCQSCYTFYSNDLQPAVSSEISMHFKPALECPVSFVRYNTSCYMVTESAMTWNSSKAYCVSVNAYLATIEDEEENSFIGNFLESKEVGAVDDRIFFGLTDSHDEGMWVTVHGDTQSFFHWTPGEPSGKSHEDCMAINMDEASKTWNDKSCTGQHLAVCEMKLI